MCAIKHLSSLTAKNRPGLPKKSVLLFDRYARKHSTCMPAMTKEKMFKAGCDQLVLQRFPCAIRSFACLGKSEGLESQRILINLVIHVNRTSNSSDVGTLGNECAVREREIFHSLTSHHN